MQEAKKLSKKEIRDELWRRGELVWKLDSTQKQLYQLFYNSNHKIMTWLLSRRQGKTYTLCVLALEQCIRKPNSIVKFVSPTKLQVNNNVRPLFRTILEDCPEEIRPEFRAKDYIYYFPNGSEIQLAGTDGGHAEKLRGGDSHLWFIDEAGSCDDLTNVVKSILLPTTLITKGKGVLASTPPKQPDHDFITYLEDAEMRGSLVKKTIYDNPRITQEQMDELIRELGGLHTEEARRELLCEIIKDSNTSVIKEFTDELAAEIVKEWPKPPFYDAYVSMDLGFQDLTAVLFGYYDFRADKIIIEDELPFNFNEQDKHLTLLAQKIDEKEKELWHNHLTGETKTPYVRVSDINMIVTNELYKVSNGRINFLNTRKDDKDSAINNVRVLLANRKIIINPRCKTLVRHLKNAKWNKNKDKFARSPDDSHYDFVDALVYLCRNVAFSKNPYPKTYDLQLRSADAHIQNPDNFYKKFDQAEVFKQLFNMKRKR
jgi:hypothetical protein